MRIPRFWAKATYKGKNDKGHSCEFIANGWSFDSQLEAQNAASERAKHIFDIVASGRKPDRYEYHDRPIKEERIEAILDGGAEIAVITRNRYGALVLNCSNTLFVDVDFPPPKHHTSRRDPKSNHDDLEATAKVAIESIEQWASRHPERSFRLYRTREGLRLLFTDKLYDPKSTETMNIMSELKADPMYVKLTRNQQCFRARLTSKPWRCGSPNPPNAFPWADPGAETLFRRWEAAYTKLDSQFKICDLVRVFGMDTPIHSLKMILDVHDLKTRIHADLPLA